MAMRRWRCSPLAWQAIILKAGFLETAITAVASPMVPISAEPIYSASEQAGPLLNLEESMARPSSANRPRSSAMMHAALPIRFW